MMRLHKSCTLETQRRALINLFIPLTSLNVTFSNHAFQADFYCLHSPTRPLLKTEKTKTYCFWSKKINREAEIHTKRKMWLLYTMEWRIDVLSLSNESCSSHLQLLLPITICYNCTYICSRLKIKMVWMFSSDSSSWFIFFISYLPSLLQHAVTYIHILPFLKWNTRISEQSPVQESLLTTSPNNF